MSTSQGNLKRSKGRPTLKQQLEKDQEELLRNPKRKCVTSYFKSSSGKSIEKPINPSTDQPSTSHDQSSREKEILSEELTRVRNENSNLRIEVMYLKRQEKNEIEILQDTNKKLQEEISVLKRTNQYITEELASEKSKLQNVLKHDMVKEVLSLSSAEKNTLKPIQKAIIKSIINNSISKRSTYSTIERDFWLDLYHNISHRVFNRVSGTLNGPWRSTVDNWSGPVERNSFNLSWRIVERSCRYVSESKSELEIPETDPITNIEKIPWSTKTTTLDDLTVVTNCMVDETALKPTVQFNRDDKCLYGFSAMPRFVLIRKINKHFDISSFFDGLTLQRDSKDNKPICGVVESRGNFIGYAQFKTYEDWKIALTKGNENFTVEMIESNPRVNMNNPKSSVDQIFQDSESIGRPHSTYVYSLMISNCCKSLPIQEITSISTNNRFLQHQDHQLLAFSVMKMLNFYGIPMFQFVADGDSRFRKQMLIMTGYVPSLTLIQMKESFSEISQNLVDESLNYGWKVKPPSDFQICHYIRKSEQMVRAKQCSYLESKANETFCAEDSSKINFYLTVPCLADVFTMSAPFIGGLPRMATQDQMHWTRKLAKSSILSTKPLRLGNYIVTFQSLIDVYQMGPQFGLLKQDVDINNKTEQASAERLISVSCLSGLNKLHWAKATQFLLYVCKLGFEAWWRHDLYPIERIANSYYVCKVFHLWHLWVKTSKLTMKSCFVTLELYRDTLVMCSSLMHLALTFKLFLPHLPFMPWKWSEFPVENYYSSVRFLFGNDDEFSALEYLYRTAKQMAQQKVQINGNISNIRNKPNASKWRHPKVPTKDKNQNLFHNDWQLVDLLNHLEKVDIGIIEDFKVLGMDALLSKQPLYKAKSARERMKNQWDLWNFGTPINTYNFINCFSPLSVSTPVISTDEIRKIRQAPHIEVDARAMTLAKYVTVYKQSGGATTSGVRNAKRFRQTTTPANITTENDGESSNEEIKAGDYFFSNTYGVIEILQLCRKKTYTNTVDDLTNINFIGIPYRRVEKTDVHFASPTYTRKYYSPLADIYKKKINISETWFQGCDKYVKLATKYPRGVKPKDNIEEEEGDSERYCFCREPGWLGGNFVPCANEDCKIQWYHLQCVNLKDFPMEDWKCPRCLDEDNWCICGGKKSRQGMVECSRQELCPVRWYHLKCAKLKSVPSGHWICDECIEDFQDDRITICFCDQKVNLDAIIKCNNPVCEISIFHKCCVGVSEYVELNGWTCQVCS
ncbi:uncharacterized protein [Clytia hemisphaerica]|uniref:PHD-type domain-containing protein n=1 Tax=Clytia hemisphaerica TaxID=252671 RepID=A0A7M5URW7_9CNID